jgi:hypothetical protein
VCASGCDYTSIKAAIAAPTTLDGDTLAIAAGTYTEAGIIVNKSLTLQGKGAANTIVQAAPTPGTASDRVFTIAGSVTVTLRELTIRHGFTVWGGAGIYNDAGTLTVINSTVSGNVSDAPGGGGLYNAGTLTLINSTVSGNSALYFDGGGLLNYGAATLMNSTISGNSAYSGGGLSNLSTSGTLTLTNSTVSGNSASGAPGGIYNVGTATFTNSTISGNSATDPGGGFYQPYGMLTLTNSIMADNPHGGDCLSFGGAIISHGYNLDSDGSCHLTAPADQPGVDPLLGPLQNNSGPTFTQALLPGSPAIDVIPWGANGCGATLVSDQRWQARPHAVEGACDSGAYEVSVAGQPLSGWVTGLTPQTVTCKDVTTGRTVTLTSPATSWDCEAAGVAVTSGDQVSMRVQGLMAVDATDIGGAVTGMAPSSGSCTNLTTGQAVTFQQMRGATAASCGVAGLVMHPGETIQISVLGVAQ